MDMIPGQVEIDYTNYRGERAVRRIQPFALVYEETEWHGWSWIVKAYDLDKKAMRSFALDKMHYWKGIVDA